MSLNTPAQILEMQRLANMAEYLFPGYHARGMTLYSVTLSRTDLTDSVTVSRAFLDSAILGNERHAERACAFQREDRDSGHGISARMATNALLRDINEEIERFAASEGWAS